MALFEQLPDELVLQILSSIDFRDLAPVCRVSHRMRNISQPLLFKKPYLRTSNAYPTCLQLFIRTLLDPGCEALATHVRFLILDWCVADMWRHDSDQTLFSDALTRLGLSGGGMSQSVQVTLLLHLLPQLHALHLLPPDETGEFINCADLLHLEKPITALPIAFQSLREFSYKIHAFNYGLPVSALLTLLKLPKIRSIDIPFGVWMDSSADRYLNTAAATSAVTHLKLSSTRISNRPLCQILKIPRALTHFSYHAQCVSIGYDFWAFGRALEPLRQSLTHLVLNFYTRDTRPANTRSVRTIGSLRDWPALQSVQCTLLPILGSGFSGYSRHLAEVLPAGIRELKISNDQYWTIGEVVNELVLLLEQREAMVPGLKRVGAYRHTETVEMRERLKIACEVAAVELMSGWPW